MSSCFGGWLHAGGERFRYLEDGSRQLDETTPVWVVIGEEKESALRALTGRICFLLKQEAIYFERSEGTIEFIRPGDSGENP